MCAGVGSIRSNSEIEMANRVWKFNMRRAEFGKIS
jgi:hypothetical protein